MNVLLRMTLLPQVSSWSLLIVFCVLVFSGLNLPKFKVLRMLRDSFFNSSSERPTKLFVLWMGIPVMAAGCYSLCPCLMKELMSFVFGFIQNLIYRMQQAFTLARLKNFKFLFFFFFNVYFRERESQSTRGKGQREKETQNLKQVPGSEPPTQGPMWGSNSWTVRSWPEPILDA